MKIIFIGGTKFVGRNMVELALKQGHEVSIIQRGKTNKDIFSNTIKYYGDRAHLEEFVPENSKFDMVIDTCGYHPAIVEKSCRFFKNKTDKYIFISTCSVYKDFSVFGLNEQSEVQKADSIPDEKAPITGENYGFLKALCENIVKDYFAERNYLILRPCIIVGQYDDTNRFSVLIDKIQTSESLNIPANSKSNIQFVDVRALAEFTLKAKDKFGIYNTIGPQKPILFSEFIELSRKLLNPGLKLKQIDANEVNLPMHISDTNNQGFFAFDGSKAYQNGFPSIEAEETIRYVSRVAK